ncbi:IS66 family transposase zinc-finger binding domain-containing protein [Bradyrhizobium sp. SZCCHNRI2007]|uniref:IS66 family transposase zinc-finger binding domain-containing protein n=1 Tax=unclassified Bradyrhizobium TaxID=2631580 RepID=UPI00396563DC
MITADSLPDDVATLKALVLAGQAALTEATAAQLAAEAKARNLEAEIRARALLIEQMKFTIAKLKHEQYGPSSERASVLEQLELELADLEEDAAEAEAAAQMAAERAKAEKVDVRPFERRRPARRPLPDHLPRERIVHPAPANCQCCGGDKLRKIGEDVTETLELVPRQWKVIQHVREKFSCRACEAITQPPAPFHPISRGRAGPRLLAHILFAKYGLHRAAPGLPADDLDVKMIDRHRDQITGTAKRTSERRISAPSLEKFSGGTIPSQAVPAALQHCACCSAIIASSTAWEDMMCKPRDFDAKLKVLEDKARGLKTRKVRQLGELVIATGADMLSAGELAGALIVLAETKEAGKREAWAKRGAAFFQNRARRTAPATDRNTDSSPAQPSGAQSASGRKGAA